MNSPGIAPAIGADFALIDHRGTPVDQTTWRGRYLVLFFGFTRCKTVCPRVLSRISEAIDGMGQGAAYIVPLYVTVDPARDTPDIMRDFLERNYPRFTGLTGSTEQSAAARRAFCVYAQRRELSDGDYEVPHTSLVYVMAPDGTLVDHWPGTLDASEMRKRLQKLFF